MNIEAVFFGQLRELTGARERFAKLKEGARLVELFEYLGETFGPEFGDKISTVEGLHIMVNGREHTMLGGNEATLRDGDTVVFLPPIFGG